MLSASVRFISYLRWKTCPSLAQMTGTRQGLIPWEKSGGGLRDQTETLFSGCGVSAGQRTISQTCPGTPVLLLSLTHGYLFTWTRSRVNPLLLWLSLMLGFEDQV